MKGLLVGERLRLTAIREADIQVMEKWFSDVYFMRHWDMWPAIPQTTRQIKETFDHYDTSPESCVFGVRLLSTDELIGVAGFDDIIPSNGTATMFIGIGALENREKGLGKESLRLLLEFGFTELNFYKLQLNVISYNEPAIRLYEGAGFVREGTFREFINRDGKRHDMYLHGLLRSEWEARR